jgi:hypothetical protein
MAVRYDTVLSGGKALAFKGLCWPHIFCKIINLCDLCSCEAIVLSHKITPCYGPDDHNIVFSLQFYCY